MAEMAKMRPLAPDHEQIRRTIETLLLPGSVVELRALDTPQGIVSGYFDDHAKLATAAAALSGKSSGVYITPNPVEPALLARAANGIKSRPRHTTADLDILSRRWLPIDIDPRRPAGISSTDAEHKAALRRADQVKDYLVHIGFPDDGLVLADSGNGAHILLRVDLPNSAETQLLLKDSLAALDLRFSDDVVSIDLCTHNPARLVKLYGTAAAKGDNTFERPHRLARLILVPPDLCSVPRDLLVKLAAVAPSKPPLGHKRGGRAFDLERWISEHGLPIKQHKPWNGGMIWILEVCPWNPAHNHGESFIVQFADGGIGAGCHHNSCHGKGWHDLKALHEVPLVHDEGRSGVPLSSCHDQSVDNHSEGDAGKVETANPLDVDLPYRSTASGILWSRATRDGHVEIPLTNFAARIVNDLAHDDGHEIAHHLEIEASLRGRTTRFTITAGQFSNMSWGLEKLGAGAVLYPGLALRDHARAGIQLISGDIPQRHVYIHTGWRCVDERWLYLHGDGAIGAEGTVEGIEVSLPDDLNGFVLPLPPEADDLVIAVDASLRMLDVAPRAVTVPVFGAVWRAALCESSFSLHLVGQTGAGKTELAALAQQHYGAGLHAKNLPSSWLSTGNSVEALAFSAKDALLVVDDFCPRGTSADIQRIHREADRVLRAQGNRRGRQRMRADATLREGRPPRGLILSTGEDVPRGQSLRSRMLILEIAMDAIDWPRMTLCQRDAGAGLYAQAMAGFVRWLAARYDTLRRDFKERVSALRQKAYTSGQHRRTPDIVANTYLGLDHFLLFAQEIGAINFQLAESLREEFWAVLGSATGAQTHHQRDNDAATRFVELLSGAIAGGRGHIAGSDGSSPYKPEAWGWREITVGTGEYERTEWRPQGERVGWVEGDDVYLEPDISYVVAQRVARESDDSLSVSAQTLRRRLRERGLVASVDETRQTLTVRRTLEGAQRRVLHVCAASLGITRNTKPDKPDIQSDPLSTGMPSSVQNAEVTRSSDPNNVGFVGLQNREEAWEVEF